jgi:hypothetical protein
MDYDYNNIIETYKTLIIKPINSITIISNKKESLLENKCKSKKNSEFTNIFLEECKKYEKNK